MKKQFFLMMMALLPMVASADSIVATEVNGFFYIFDNTNQTASVSFKEARENNSLDYWGWIYTTGDYSGAVEIPSEVTYNDITYRVTSIGKNAFEDCSGITSITIPNSVEAIGFGAFFRCSNLTSVTIPESVKKIGDNAFNGCTGLTSIAIPNSVTDLGHPFQNCSNLSSITIADGATGVSLSSFKETAWYNNLSDGLVYIGKHCLGYKGNKPTGSITINEGTKSIANHAFYKCTGLTSIMLPNSVETIGEVAFEDCSSLASITIPESVKSIGRYAFAYCSRLSNITIPNNVSVIDSYTFSGCCGLSSIIIPNSVETIGTSAFNGCNNLTSITIPESVKSICDYAFRDCSGLTSIYIPKNVTSIEDGVFKDCNKLFSITIPESVKSIGDYAFDGCSSLKSIYIPKNVTSIEGGVFNGCNNLTSIIVEEGNAKYDSRNNCNAIIETETNTLIYGCNTTTIPNDVESIGIFAFSDCNGLVSITIPKGVESIGKSAFRNCNGLVSITIPKGVTSIGIIAFQGCTSLISLTIDKTEPITINKFHFDKIDQISLYVPKGSADAYKAADVWKDFKEIKEFFRDDVATYTIENEEKTLTVNAVAEPIEETVYIPESVSVDGTACPVTAIAANAFESNTVIKKVSIPETIEEIGDAAFSGCSDLNTITCHAEEPIALGSAVAATRTRAADDKSTPNVFDGVDKVTCLLYVPAGSVDKYKSASGWKDFKYIVGIGTNFVIGDVNDDKEVNDKDLQALIAHVMDNELEGTFDDNMADVNQDGHVDINDVVFLVKLMGRNE